MIDTGDMPFQRAAHRIGKAGIKTATEIGIYLQYFSSRARVKSLYSLIPRTVELQN